MRRTTRRIARGTTLAIGAVLLASLFVASCGIPPSHAPDAASDVHGQCTMHEIRAVDLRELFGVPAVSAVVMLPVAVMAAWSVAVLGEILRPDPQVRQRGRRLRWLWARRLPFLGADPFIPSLFVMRDA